MHGIHRPSLPISPKILSRCRNERTEQSQQGKHMFESASHRPAAIDEFRPASTYAGAERRSTSSVMGACLVGMLDEIDYGMLLIKGEDLVLYLNHAARLELDGDHPLQLMGQGLRTKYPQDLAPLFNAMAAAQRGLRRLVTLGVGQHRVSISVVPLPAQAAQRAGDREATTLVVLGKRRVCGQLSVQGFARSMSLTPAETRVLELLCSGVRPAQVAQQHDVKVSTVRTQIGSIRGKTGASSISELVRQVAVLPPLVGALRHLSACR